MGPACTGLEWEGTPCCFFFACRSIRLVRQKFSAEDDIDTVAFRACFTFDVDRKIDRTHDAVTELFVDEFLYRSAI
jgi:hypothetical protein